MCSHEVNYAYKKTKITKTLKKLQHKLRHMYVTRRHGPQAQVARLVLGIEQYGSFMNTCDKVLNNYNTL